MKLEENPVLPLDPRNLNARLTDILRRIHSSVNLLQTTGAVIPVIGISDGTVGAPGLAWASEPGLGWYRIGTSTIGFAAQGALVSTLSAQSSTQTYTSQNPRAAGSSFFQAVNAPYTATNYNSVSFGVDQTHAYLNSTKGGSNTDKPFDFIGANGYSFDNIVYGFPKTAGGEGTILLINQPAGVNNYHRLQLGATPGGVVLYGAGFGGAAKPSMYFDAAGFAFSGGGISAPAFGAPLFNLTGGAATNWVQDANNVYFQMAPSWFWSYGKASGTLGWQHGGGPTTALLNNGDFQAGRNVLAAGGQLGLISTAGQSFLRFTIDNWRLEYGGGHLYYNNPSNTNLWRIQSDGNMVLPIGNGFKPGGGVWADISDERIKENIADYATGLDSILALRPRTYTFKPATGRDPTKTYVGLIAQECQAPMPEMVSAMQGIELGKLAFDDLLSLDTTPLVFALVNAVKQLEARVRELEAPTQPTHARERTEGD